MIAVVVGALFALMPALLMGLGAGFLWQNWESGIIVGIGMFGIGLDVIFNGRYK